MSATFYTKADAIAFFDNLDTVKGPSLGTNFTLSSPYVILAHYGELDWVRKILFLFLLALLLFRRLHSVLLFFFSGR